MDCGQQCLKATWFEHVDPFEQILDGEVEKHTSTLVEVLECSLVQESLIKVTQESKQGVIRVQELFLFIRTARTRLNQCKLLRQAHFVALRREGLVYCALIYQFVFLVVVLTNTLF